MTDNKAQYPVCKSILAAELSPKECEILTKIMKQRKLKDHELLIKEGEAATTLFVLTEGQLAVINKTDDEENVVYVMKEGECAGTRAFVDRTPRKATLRAVDDATVYTLEPDVFETLVDSHPRIVYKVMRALFRITHQNLMRMNQETEQLANYISKSGGRY